MWIEVIAVASGLVQHPRAILLDRGPGVFQRFRSSGHYAGSVSRPDSASDLNPPALYTDA